MLSQEQWIALTDPASPVHWKERYRLIGIELHAVLRNVPPDDAISATDLVNRLLPDPEGPDGVEATKRIYRIIGKDVTSFPAAKGWFTIIYGRNRFNGTKNIRRRIWHSPDAEVTAVPPQGVADWSPDSLETITDALSAWWHDQQMEITMPLRVIVADFLGAVAQYEAESEAEPPTDLSDLL